MTALEWPELYFIRHGETAWNAERRYQGRRDIPLNPRGQAQADANGLILRDLFERREIDPTALDWHVSPLGRARETMERVRAAFAGPLPAVEIDPRLIEISFGQLEGLLHSELAEHMATAPGERDAQYWHFRPEGGENYPDVEARLTEFSAALRGPSVVVAHGGIARVLRVLVEHAPVGEVINWPPPQDAIMHFTEGRLELVRAGDV
jgi:probable phosphoglycerate mutase